MKLYPYQENAVSHAIQMIAERGNSLIVAGTGAGKTIMMAATIGRFFKGFKAAHKRSPHILVLVHRTEIHTQNHSKFALVNPDIQTSEITAGRKSVKGFVHFGMVQTVANIMPELEKANSYFDLIVIDEAHHAKASTYEEIISRNLKGNPEAALLGVTATPNRGDKLPLVHLFDNFYQVTSKFLIDSHYLTRPRFIDRSPVFKTKTGSEKGHLQKNCKNDIEGIAIINHLCDDYLKYKEDGKSIIFAPSHEFCERIYARLKELGRSPAYLSIGLDDASRKEELRRFEDGECDELINVDICTEGYDYPPLRNLVEFDTNGTQGQWIQKVGRVLRTAPGKTSCTVIDFGGNIELYPDGVETDVNLEGVVKMKKGQRLTERDLFREVKDKNTQDIIGQDKEIYTPYHLPRGFESVNDSDYGIVFVACFDKADCIVVENSGEYSLFIGTKTCIKWVYRGDFNDCMQRADRLLKGEVFERDEKPISSMQIRLLAPEYPTTALDWYGANCCICWKTWKNEISRGDSNDGNN